jgi:hypothetical protein
MICKISTEAITVCLLILNYQIQGGQSIHLTESMTNERNGDALKDNFRFVSQKAKKSHL